MTDALPIAVNKEEGAHLKHRVFVYGTLKKNQPNHHWFSKCGNYKFLGTARLVDARPLVIAGPFHIPYMMDTPGQGKNVTGEVYDVDDESFAQLDILERYPTLYTRKQIPVTMLDDEPVTEHCWCYLLVNPKPCLFDLPHLDSYDNNLYDETCSYVRGLKCSETVMNAVQDTIS